MMTTRQITRFAARAGLLAAAAASLTACVSPENDSLSIGGGVHPIVLEAFDAREGQPLHSGNGINREAWGETVILAPVHGTIHRPTYTTNRRLNRATARSQGFYPSVQTATERVFEGPTRLREEAAVSHVDALVDLVLLLPRMVIDIEPGAAVRSPDVPYQRQPARDIPEPDDTPEPFEERADDTPGS